MPGDIALFVTNLRLLDLHEREDWPGITPHLFSGKDAQQTLNGRVRSVEWALYHLFEFWDAQFTRDVSQNLRSSSTSQCD